MADAFINAVLSKVDMNTSHEELVDTVEYLTQ